MAKKPSETLPWGRVWRQNIRALSDEFKRMLQYRADAQLWGVFHKAFSKEEGLAREYLQGFETQNPKSVDSYTTQTLPQGKTALVDRVSMLRGRCQEVKDTSQRSYEALHACRGYLDAIARYCAVKEVEDG